MLRNPLKISLVVVYFLNLIVSPSKYTHFHPVSSHLRHNAAQIRHFFLCHILLLLKEIGDHSYMLIFICRIKVSSHTWRDDYWHNYSPTVNSFISFGVDVQWVEGYQSCVVMSVR